MSNARIPTSGDLANPDDFLAERGFDLVALCTAVDSWAATTTASDSPRRTDLLRDKTRMVLSFFEFTQRSPATVQPLDVRAWRLALERRGLAAETVYAHISRLSSFYTWARRHPALAAALPYNPALLERPTRQKPYQSRGTKAWTTAEVTGLLEHIKQLADEESLPALRDYALLVIYILTGLRRREVIQLRAGDLAWDGEAMLITTQMKGSQTRTKRIDAPIAGAAVRAYLAATGRELAALPPEAPLWLAHDRATTMTGRERWRDRRPGDPLGSHGFAKNLKHYALDAGLGDVHVHQTRHTFAALIGEDAETLAEVQEALHHRDLATTRVYLDRVMSHKDRHSRHIARKIGLES
jgi:site-specific recombinase XerD